MHDSSSIHFDVVNEKYQGSRHTILIEPFEDGNLFTFLQQGRDAYLHARDRGDSRLPPAIAAR